MGVSGTYSKQKVILMTIMKNFYLFLLLLITGVASAQGLACDQAAGFCPPENPSDPPVQNGSGVGEPNLGDVACLGSTPNARWTFIQIEEPGTLVFNIRQYSSFSPSGTPQGNSYDVDFVAFGPFNTGSSNSPTAGDIASICNQIDFGWCPNCPNNTSSSANYPYGQVVDCSYDPSYTETLTITNAQVGEVYMVLITNYSNQPASYLFTQTNNTAGNNNVGIPGCAMCGVDILEPAVLCAGGAVTLEAVPSNPGGTYQWADANGPIAGATSDNLTVTAPGNYSVTYTVQVFGSSVDCVRTTTKPVVSYTAPNFTISTFEFCNVSSPNVDLSGVAGNITGINPSDYIINFHPTELDAIYQADFIYNYASYPATEGETIWISFQPHGSECVFAKSFQISIVCDIPVPSVPVVPIICDNGTIDDGLANFNLTTVPTQALGSYPSADYVVTVHPTQADAVAGTNPINTAVPYSSATANVLWVRLTAIADNTIFGTASFTLNYNLLPKATMSSGPAAVCQNDSYPVTFTTTQGTAPYIYTYTINGVSHTQNSNAATTTIQVPTTTAGPVTVSLLNITDANCSRDLSAVQSFVVNPTPSASIVFNTTSTCQGAGGLAVTFTGSNSTGNYSFNYTLNGAPATILSAGGNTATLILGDVVGTYTVNLVSVTSNGCTQNIGQTISATIHALPTASVAIAQTEICENGGNVAVTFTAVGGVAPYTFNYTLNGTAQNIATTGSATTAVLNIPSTTVGLFTVGLVSVADANCTNAQPGTVSVQVKDMPNASAAISAAEVCVGSGGLSVTFTATDAAAPYTFDYTLNGAAATLTSNAAGVAVLNLGDVAGTYTVNLVSVTADGCTNNIGQTVTGVIHDNPTATVAIAQPAICQNAGDVAVTFTAIGGTAPYTFSYTLNGTAQTAVSLAGQNTVVIQAPSTALGVQNYVLTGVSDNFGCNATLSQTVSLTVNSIPTATLVAATTALCVNTTGTTVTFTGASGVAPYTFTYSVNGAAPQTLTGATAVLPVDTSVAGLINVTLIEVSDANCSQVINESVQIQVNPIATATIAVSATQACLNGVSPTVVINGALGTAPYTFTYSVNGGANQTHTTAAAVNVFTLPVDTSAVGTQIVTLISVSDVNGCQSAINQSVNIEIVAPLPIPAFANLVMCDTNNDGISCFDLTATLNTITSGNPNYVASVHPTQTDAELGTNPIAGTTFCNANPWNQSVYIRLVHIGAPDCGSVAELTLTVNPTPIALNNIPAYALCDDNAPGDGLEIFQLDSWNVNLLANTTGVTFTYYTSQVDAQNGVNPISASHQSAGEIVWVRMENVHGCVGIASFELIVHPVPVAQAFVPTPVCAIDATNQAVFPLGDYSNYIHGGIPGVTVRYFATQADAENEVNALPSNFTSVDTMIYVRLDNAHCHSISTLPLVVAYGPAIASGPFEIRRCDPNNDGVETFDLSPIIPQVTLGVAGLTATFHETQDDARLGTNPVSLNYTNPNPQPTGQTLYIRVVSAATGCASFATVQLIPEPTPMGNETPDPVTVCDLDQDGMGFFDLSSAINNLLNGLDATTHTVRFWPTLVDAQNGTNEILGINAYHSTGGSVWVTIQAATAPCLDFIELPLQLNGIPTLVHYPNAVTPITLCDVNNPGDMTEVFDLTSRIQSDIVGGQTGLEVTFYPSYDDALNLTNAITTPEAYANVQVPVQTLGVVVKNVATGCFVVTVMDIRVEPLAVAYMPTPNDPRLNLCDTNQDGVAEFDLTALVAYMQQGDATTLISFHPTQEDAENNTLALSSPYSNINPFIDQVYVRAESSLTGCFSVRELTLNVTPAPVVPTDLDTLASCDYLNNTQDGIAIFDLTQHTAAILAAQGGGIYTVEYYDSLAAAQAGLAPILNPTAYATASAEIFFRIEGGTGCSNVGSFFVHTNAPMNLPLSLGRIDICDDELPGSTMLTHAWDLTDVNLASMLGLTELPAGVTVEWYESLAAAQAGVSPITGDALTSYVNIQNPQALGIRFITAEGCQSTTMLTISVLPLPTIRPLNDTHIIHICDTDATPGTEEFDLTQFETYMANGDTSLAFTYHLTEADAVVGTNPIATPTAYVSGSATIYIRVERTTSMPTLGTPCSVVQPMQIVVDILPIVATDPIPYPLCAPAGAVTATFDLTSLYADILDPSLNVADYSFTFYTATGAVGLINNPSAFAGADNQTIYVIVSNLVTNCASVEATIVLDLQEEAVAHSVTQGPVCADATSAAGDTHVFDLTAFEAEILGTQDATQFSVAYFMTNDDALAHTNEMTDIGAFETATTTIYAVVTNNLSDKPCRSQVLAIYLEVEPLLNVGISGSNTLCVEYPSGNTVAPGTLLEVTGVADPTAYVFEWYLDGVALGVNASTYYAQSVGTYTVDVMSALGCLSTTATPHTLVETSAPVIAGVQLSNYFGDNQSATVVVEGTNPGAYEYSLDGGAWQTSPVFTNLSLGSHTVSVRSGCGEVSVDFVTVDYPHFFTPNGDGFNDTWNISWDDTVVPSPKIFIYDRYGKLLKQISANGEGWDGTYNGSTMPSTDYWFQIFYIENGQEKEFKAHFALKR